MKIFLHLHYLCSNIYLKIWDYTFGKPCINNLVMNLIINWHFIQPECNNILTLQERLLQCMEYNESWFTSFSYLNFYLISHFLSEQIIFCVCIDFVVEAWAWIVTFNLCIDILRYRSMVKLWYMANWSNWHEVYLKTSDSKIKSYFITVLYDTGNLKLKRYIGRMGKVMGVSGMGINIF